MWLGSAWVRVCASLISLPPLAPRPLAVIGRGRGQWRISSRGRILSHQQAFATPPRTQSRSLSTTAHLASQLGSGFPFKHSVCLASTGHEKLEALGRAKGLPRSEERRNDLDRLWEMNLPELHLAVPHENDYRQNWLDQFLGLQPGQYHFLAVVTKLPEDRAKRALLETLTPEWAPVILQPENQGLYMFASGLWVWPTDENGKSKISHGRKLYPDRHRAVEEMDSHNIGISNHGEFRFRWQRNDGTKLFIKLNAAFAKPRFSTDFRAVRFTKDGIDIVDGLGNILRPANYNGYQAPASIPRSRFLTSMKWSKDLVELWEAVLDHLGIQQRTKDIGPVNLGVPMISGGESLEKPKQNRPPQKLDANYLLYLFLKQRFPKGGTFRTAPKSRDKTSTEDLAAFINFLKQPEFRGHPYTRQWLADLDRHPPLLDCLEPNLWILRSVSKLTTLVHPKARAGAQETYFELGPPGSARPWSMRNQVDTSSEDLVPPTRSLTKGTWSKEDDSILLRERALKQTYSRIQELYLPLKSLRSLGARYRELRKRNPPPSLREAWTPEDDTALMQARASGLTWRAVQLTFFPSKTWWACQRRYLRLVQHQDFYQALAGLPGTQIPRLCSQLMSRY